MNTIFRNTRVLPKRFYANGLIVQRANFMSSDDRGRVGPLGKPRDYSPDYSMPMILKLAPILTIIGVVGFVIAKEEGLFGWNKAQVIEEDKHKKKKKWLFVYNSKNVGAPPYMIVYPYYGLEEGKSSRNNQNYWTNPKNIQKYEESVSVDRIYLKSK